MAAAVITPHQQELLYRRPSRVNSIFELAATSSKPAGKFSAAFNRIRYLLGVKSSTIPCQILFEGSDLVIKPSQVEEKPKEATGGVFKNRKRKQPVSPAGSLTELGKVDLRTTQVELGEAKTRRNSLVKVKLIDGSGGPPTKLYAANTNAAGDLLFAVVKERQRAFEESPVEGHHWGKELLEYLRVKDVSNRVCADCPAANPEWVSFHKKDKLASLICIDCAGVHRKLGTDNVFVQSLMLDAKTWRPGTEMRDILMTASNALTNKMRTARGLLKRRPSVLHTPSAVNFPELEREEIITEKYAELRGRSPSSPGENTVVTFVPPRSPSTDAPTTVVPEAVHKRRRTVDVELF